MAEAAAKSRSAERLTEAPAQPETYVRFDWTQRVEHMVLLVSFTLLAVTGLPQKFATAPAGEVALRLLGGIELARVIHRVAAIVLLGESIYHIVAVLYRVLVRRVSLSMMPVVQDLQHLFHDILFYLERRKRKAYYGRYSYAEKVEYLAVVWGTVIMAITGFMMWNPIATARWLRGDFIPAAKAAHGGEALLAVLAIILWHFYHVHIRHFNRSMFSGQLTREEMRHEHPAELALIEAGRANKAVPAQVLRRRQQYFFPVAAVLALLLGYGLYLFATFEETAIAYVPPAESAPVFVPITPTPAPTATPTTPPEPGEVAAGTWDGSFSGLFRNRCGTCHVGTAVGGLSLATFQDALEGGNAGPGIVPGDPDASQVVLIQSAGGHPGQLTIDELGQVIDWIKKGAPEK